MKYSSKASSTWRVRDTLGAKGPRAGVSSYYAKRCRTAGCSAYMHWSFDISDRGTTTRLIESATRTYQRRTSLGFRSAKRPICDRFILMQGREDLMIQSRSCHARNCNFVDRTHNDVASIFEHPYLILTFILHTRYTLYVYCIAHICMFLLQLNSFKFMGQICFFEM